MKRFIWLAIGFLFLLPQAQAEDRRSDTSRLVIMTLNGEFLWDGVDPEEGQVDFDWKGSPDEAGDHMAEIAEIIIRNDPDIVNLVEVEGLPALTRLNDEYLTGRGYRPYLVKGKDTYTGQDVGLLTRIDPENNAIERFNVAGRSGNVTKSVSKNYYAKFEIGTLKFAVIGLHFLARPLDPGRLHPRQAQADAIQELGENLMAQGYALVVLGDFNDYDGNADSLDHIDSTPITDVLERIRRMKRGDQNDDLVNVASRISKNQRYTAYWDRDRDSQIDAPQEFTSIDHILVSSSLLSRVEQAYIPKEHDPRWVADHFAVVVEMSLDGGHGQPGVRLVSILPNPAGDERAEESATLKNEGTSAVSLVGWTLRDLQGKTWSLDSLGTLNPNEEKTIRREGQPMAMTNRGDSIDLVDPNGNVVQTITYSSTTEGELVVAY